MTEQATFVLRNRNPDVLTCIANLSNDEVFTPPEIVNQMLDILAEAWANGNAGASLWADSAVRFLDPFTKSGVFLREIVTRLTAGLEEEIPDLQERIDHILTRQVFGIALTSLTSLLARRSVYCSKWANGEHSIAKAFEDTDGNIWFKRTEHAWEGGKPVRGVHPINGHETVTYEGGRCKWCGAPRSVFDREEVSETHAYKFIHGDDPAAILADAFGDEMQFDVVIGNPPYQMTGGAGGSSDSSIYQLFVEQAIKLQPRFLSMVVPSRWMAGGRGMDEFRTLMLKGRHLSHLVDYTKMSTAFPGVDFEGGVGYFLWDSAHDGACDYILVQGDERQQAISRDLGAFDVFIRDHRALSILEKVIEKGEASITEIFTNREPFKLESNFRSFHANRRPEDVALHYIDKGKRGIGYVARGDLTKNTELIDKWKVLVPKAYGERGATPAMVLGRPLIASAPSACTGSFLFFWVETEAEALSLLSYYSTRFFRFLVSLRKITQDAFRPMYAWVPIQSWDRVWTDADLYSMYGLDADQVEYLESVIRPMASSVE